MKEHFHIVLGIFLFSFLRPTLWGPGLLSGTAGFQPDLPHTGMTRELKQIPKPGSHPQGF